MPVMFNTHQTVGSKPDPTDTESHLQLISDLGAYATALLHRTQGDSLESHELLLYPDMPKKDTQCFPSRSPRRPI
jgi:hypothetical protein